VTQLAYSGKLAKNRKYTGPETTGFGKVVPHQALTRRIVLILLGHGMSICCTVSIFTQKNISAPQRFGMFGALNRNIWIERQNYDYAVT
jgi:hypothetical protein